METVLPEGSPLADLLADGQALEGEGQSLMPETGSSAIQDYVPLSSPSTSLGFRLRRSATNSLRLRLPNGRVISHQTWTPKVATDARFLDHFRYVLVASQLLEENPDHGLLQRSEKDGAATSTLPPSLALFSYKGAAVAAGLAFLAVWVLTAAMRCQSRILATTLVLGLLSFGGVIISLHGMRQVIRYAHLRALESASKLILDLQNFELASASALSLVQEVEIVAKGFKRVPGNDVPALRRCRGLRRSLGRSYIRVSDCLKSALSFLKQVTDLDDYEKFLDIYDVPREVLGQAVASATVDDADIETIGALRILNFCSSTLRRAVICALLSLRVDSDSMGYYEWQAVVNAMDCLSKDTAKSTSNLVECLNSLEDLAVPSTPIRSSKVSNERIKAQVRKIGSLSSSIKSLQAKMTLLREESNAAISRAEELGDLGPTLIAQYESIGADIDSLRQAWESGKAILSANISEQEKRISLASPTSPTSTRVFSPRARLLFGEEGGPADALRALSGERLPPVSDASMSPTLSMPGTPSDEEVFEAIALPKPRSSLNREERIRIMHEERAKADERRVRQESGLNMMRELRTVINLRKRPDQPPGPRVTSI